LPSSYRSHGSLYEQDVPLIIHNAQHAPPKDYFRYNVDLARWLYPISPTGAHGEAVTARAL
jgi:phosphonoacetate hydrolase